MMIPPANCTAAVTRKAYWGAGRGEVLLTHRGCSLTTQLLETHVGGRHDREGNERRAPGLCQALS